VPIASARRDTEAIASAAREQRVKLSTQAVYDALRSPPPSEERSRA